MSIHVLPLAPGVIMFQGISRPCMRTVCYHRAWTVTRLTRAGVRYCQAIRCIQIIANPAVERMDEPVDIKVTGLPPGQPVTMAARLQEEGDTFVSHAHYVADAEGSVDLTKQHSVGGTYEGCEPMGLFWALEATEGSKSGSRLRKKDVTQPHIMSLSLAQDHVRMTQNQDHDDPNILAQIQLERHYMWKGVRRIPVRHGALRGTLFIPNEGQGRHQGVIDIYGSTGGLPEYRAAMLASRGFTTFALAYLGYEDLPKGLEVSLDYFQEAIDFMCNHENVAPGGVGAIGISLGAVLALQMSILNKQLIATVAIGSMETFCMTIPRYQGQILPYTTFDPAELDKKEEGLSLMKAMFNADGQEEAILQVEKATHTDFLFLHGAHEEMCDPRVVLKMTSRMVEHGHKNFSLHLYEGAGHLIEPPYTPFCYLHWHKTLATNVLCGGMRNLHTKAQEDAWQKILTFFRTRLPKTDTENIPE